MILPLYDDNSDRRLVPIVNFVLIGLNIFVFVVFQGFGTNEKFLMAYSCVPREIVTGEDIVTPDERVKDRKTGEINVRPGHGPVPTVYLTLLTSMFMHGGLMHLAGNMLFLWIFGDNIEDAIGRVRYVIFYLLCGLAASMAHVLVTVALHGVDSQAAQVPSLGASGAISGVMGAYLVLHPNRQVVVLMFRFLTQVPAWVAIGMWFVFQLINGLGMLGPGNALGGVAYAAHIGGFLAGMVLVFVFMGGHRATPAMHVERTPERLTRRWR